MINDYRNTIYCSALEEIQQKKQKLKEDINTKYPRTKVLYNKIRPKDGEYISEFMKIYNHKCAYCGVSIKIIPLDLFEVDHYIYEKSFDTTEEAGQVENLVLTCSKCNRAKGKYHIKNKYVDLLNTDNGNISKVFKRDDDYYIRIEEEFDEDEKIISFYEKLKLKYQVRRLDYLLMSMKGLYETIKDRPESSKLGMCILEIENKRRLF